MILTQDYFFAISKRGHPLNKKYPKVKLWFIMLGMGIEIIAIILIIIISIVIHELAHGYMALFLGDPTAKYAGRLTMNPIKHMSFIGSFLVPLILAMMPGNFIFGWAKPVPYNPYNLKNQKWGEILIAIAGPISNILIAIIFAMFIRFGFNLGLSPAAIEMSLIAVKLNVFLAIFNMIPIPPLDGSKVLFNLLPNKFSPIRNFLETNYLFALVLFVLFGSYVLIPISNLVLYFLL
jgi:Zn-dependent protease